MGRNILMPQPLYTGAKGQIGPITDWQNTFRESCLPAICGSLASDHKALSATAGGP
jgi:hypothetical protein